MHPRTHQTPSSLWMEEARQMLALAWPLSLAQLAQMAFHITDMVMMGWVGKESLAGMGLASALISPLLVGGFGVVSATAPMVAQALGAHDLKSVRRTVRQGLWIGLFISALIMPFFIGGEHIFVLLGQPAGASDLAARYLDIAALSVPPALAFMVIRLFISAKGNTQTILFITLFAVILNVGINYVLIFGHLGFPAFGIVGAAIATTFSNWLMLALGMVYAARHPKYKRHFVFVRFFKPDWPRFFEFFRIGMPIGLTNIAEVGLFGFAVIMMGWFGTEAVAAHSIAIQYASISFMVPLGLAQATTIHVGHAKGARDLPGIGRAGWMALLMTLAFMSMTLVLFVTVPRQLSEVFLDPTRPENASTLALASGYLVIAGLFQLADGTQVAMASALRGLSDTRAPMLVAMVGYWIVGLSVAYLFAFVLDWQGNGVWTGLASGLAFVAVVLTIRWSQRERLGLVHLPEHTAKS